MRLWHKDLISVLPRQQLLGQWRECCLIAKNIAEKCTPNHILVNKITEQYDITHFKRYCKEVYDEMLKREYKCDWDKLDKYLQFYFGLLPSHNELFHCWHNDRYLKQCLYNLQEKYDCGGISDEEWGKITEFWINNN